MIELNSKTQQDFLNREWVQRLLDAGVDMSDAKYVIAKDLEFPWVGATDTDYIYYKDNVVGDDKWYKNVKHLLETIKIIKEDDHINWQTQTLPTYTVSELLYKLREKQGIYTIFNNLRNNDIDNTPIIESLASILLQQYNETI